ncbi:hypothetical protein PR048_027852, partial [Dryococelus australis]
MVCPQLDHGDSVLAAEAMTCQELLALSGALSAALPTGQLGLGSFFSSLSKGPEPLLVDEHPRRWSSPETCCGEQPWSAMLEPTTAGACKRRRRHSNVPWRWLLSCCIASLRRARRLVKALVDHKYFQQGILLAILINTLSMGIEYHNQVCPALPYPPPAHTSPLMAGCTIVVRNSIREHSGPWGPRWLSGYPARLPPRRTGFDPPAGLRPHSRMCESCRTMPLVDLPFPPPLRIPALLHVRLVSPSSALKTSMLRAALIYPPEPSHRRIHPSPSIHPHSSNIAASLLATNLSISSFKQTKSIFFPEELTIIVEISNIVFSAIFAVEMVLKIIAEGPFGYVANGFNVFDGVIVVLSECGADCGDDCNTDCGTGCGDDCGDDRGADCYCGAKFTAKCGECSAECSGACVLLRARGDSEGGCCCGRSVIEMCQTYLGEGEGSSGLSVLRTFRLLRILKLVRFMPNLRRQLFVMLRTMDNVAVFFSLLVLFIFIFSILGMNLFGCKFCEKNDDDDDSESCDRKNFDSLLWAIVTVFQ